MGEPVYLMRSFSYNDTRLPPHQPNNQGNHVHALGRSVSSVKFMSDSLDCEKWSNVSRKCYVEEAKRYTQPGSVAEKKAFFDAYYKKLAAQKAAAAALLEQEKAAAADAAAIALQVTSKVADLAIDNNNIVDAYTKNLEVSHMERPMLKSKPNAVAVYHRKDNIRTPRTKNVITNDYTDKRSLAPKSLKVLMNSSFVKESCRKTQSTEPASTINSTPKRSVTPMKTPSKPFVNVVNRQPLATVSVNRRIETPAHPTIVGSKSSGPKWHILSAVSKSLTAYKSKLKSPTTISSPFVLRTEDRAARRKQKLEEKFNEKQVQIVQQKARFKEKAEKEFITMHESMCFKALPLPDFYKGRDTPEKILEANKKSFTPRETPRKIPEDFWRNNNQNRYLR